MKLSEWPPLHAAGVPEQLRTALLERLAAHGEPDRDIADACARAAEQTLREVLARRDSSRAIARDLLAADALATHACAAAARERGGDPAALERWCDALIARFGALLNDPAAT